MTDEPERHADAWNWGGEALRPMYYNPDGEPISMEDWSSLMGRRMEEARDGIPRESWWGRKTVIGELEISTVWLGLDHSFLEGPPLTWETMIFGDPRYSDEQWRYSTRAQAYDHHEEIVRSIRAGRDPE